MQLGYFKGFLLVCLAGSIWSFGPLLIKHMDNASQFQIHYLFFRGLAICSTVLIYMLYRVQPFALVQINSVASWLGGLFLAFAMLSFIYSITLTTAAVTLFILASGPFLTALLSYLLLKEKLTLVTFLSMCMAFVGICVMVLEDYQLGTIWGAVLGLLAALGYSLFTISLRWSSDPFVLVFLGGIFSILLALGILQWQGLTPAMSVFNISLSLAHGLIVGLGMILYSLGSRYLPATELSLLSLVEVVGGVVWVSLPLFGVNEPITLVTILGGALVCLGIVLFGYFAHRSAVSKFRY